MRKRFDPMKTKRKPLTKIQKSARGENCTLRIPGVCNGNSETVCLCHAPYPTRFGSRKDDHWAVYGCSECHDFVDGRNNKSFNWAGMLTGMAEYWMPAIHETQAKLIEKGLMTV